MLNLLTSDGLLRAECKRLGLGVGPGQQMVDVLLLPELFSQRYDVDQATAM
jgi:hypothetical protein